MAEQHISLRLVALSMLLLFFLPSYPQEKNFIRKVVIDAGHGGKDPGTIGKKVQEKAVALAIALLLGERIEKSCSDVKVFYTRKTDEFIELFQRAEIANKNYADLFISIHCNANPSHSLQGSETYVMGLHKTRQNLEISKIENASILMEPDYLTNYNGFDPNSDESYITFSLFQNAFLKQSTEFASDVQKQIVQHIGMTDRGVRQAGFLVLYKTIMPSVLIETGFLSNVTDENFLISKSGQENMADAICKAFLNYKAKAEKSQTTAPSTPTIENEKKPDPVKNSSPEIASAEKEKKKAPEVKPLPTAKRENKKVDTLIGIPKDYTISFSVQIAAYPKEIGVQNTIFKGLKGVSLYKENGLYKYIIGKEKDFSMASRL
ncbi:MAG: N-acetylmuramoyl-L-alanine amidase, partial [Bacteroidota bacterium]